MMGANYITESRLTLAEREHLYDKPIGYTFIHRGEIMVMSEVEPLRLEREPVLRQWDLDRFNVARINRILKN